MAASVFDSPAFAQLFPTGEAGRLFTDSAAIRAMMLVEGALAKVQGAQGVIPQDSAAAIHRASLEIQIDPGELAQATGQNGVSVPGLVNVFRKRMQAPEHAQYLHWGATSQDVIDTALMLKLRQLLALIEDDLRCVINILADDAEAHAETPMAARTYGQHATPTSWGAVLASFGAPLADLLEALPELRRGSLYVSLSGAAGTASALGPQAPETRAALAEALGLADPKRSWHVDRGPILRIADWLVAITAQLARMGATLIELSSTEIAEVKLGTAGASSTMPQKQNPVGPSALQALGHVQPGLRAALTPATQHLHQRDGAAWFAEWMVLPQICLNAASALTISKPLCNGLEPDVARMAHNLALTKGLIHAEALSFALVDKLPRSEAQNEVKKLSSEALTSGTSLKELTQKLYTGFPQSVFEPHQQLGFAPTEARAFAARARTI